MKEAPSAVQSSGSGAGSEKKEQVFLKKTDPPKWDGDPINYADFVRKWKAQVSKANLPPESELDRLRENIPSQASKALFGESTMAKAWKILESLYGDKDMIANLLKTQLKNIKVKGKVDHDIVIELVTDVNNIVLRLKAIDMESMLHVDTEFLSAVYRVLPSVTQSKWLEFDKSCFSSKWAGFMKFMEVARDQALQNKVLISCYVQHSSIVSGSFNAAVVTEVEDDKKEREKKARDECGKCPLCKKFHSFYFSKERMHWPSDRLFKCEEFRRKSVRERAGLLEKFGCCPQCTSWTHERRDCTVLSL